ncbi:hypothetical protein M8C21_026392, partial [Ambrosia artemisiifolia]
GYVRHPITNQTTLSIPYNCPAHAVPFPSPEAPSSFRNSLRHWTTGRCSTWLFVDSDRFTGNLLRDVLMVWIHASIGEL